MSSESADRRNAPTYCYDRGLRRENEWRPQYTTLCIRRPIAIFSLRRRDWPVRSTRARRVGKEVKACRWVSSGASPLLFLVPSASIALADFGLLASVAGGTSTLTKFPIWLLIYQVWKSGVMERYVPPIPTMPVYTKCDTWSRLG